MSEYIKGIPSLGAGNSVKSGAGNGLKFDSGKIPYELIDWQSVEELAQILQFGATKYGPNNWQRLDNAIDRYFSAAMRHLLAYRAGEKKDPETGQSHLAHLLCNVMFLRYFERNE